MSTERNSVPSHVFTTVLDEQARISDPEVAKDIGYKTDFDSIVYPDTIAINGIRINGRLINADEDREWRLGLVEKELAKMATPKEYHVADPDDDAVFQAIRARPTKAAKRKRH